MVRMCGADADGDETPDGVAPLGAGLTVMPTGTVRAACGVRVGMPPRCRPVGTLSGGAGVALGAAGRADCTLVRWAQPAIVGSASVAARASLRMVEARADAV